MKAQDRDAIRTLLAAQEDQWPRPRELKKKAPKKKDKWWRTSTEVDPISLEPLAELDYPPFELGPHLFDGRVLAFYLVSTGTFLSPMNREALTMDDCAALDTYLASNNLDAARVADALRLQKALSAETGRDDAAAQQQRRQATAVLHGLFGFARYGDSAAARPGQRGSGGGNLRSAYDDDDRSSGGLIDDGDIGNDASDDDVLPEAAFPALASDAPRDIDQGAGWRRAASSQGGVLAASALTTEDFPTLGGPARNRPQPQAPRFRDAVRPYAIDAHEGHARGAQRARQVHEQAVYQAAAPPTYQEAYPSLGGMSTSSARARVVAEQYRALALSSSTRPAAQSSGLSKRERERARRRDRDREQRRTQAAGLAPHQGGGSVVARIRACAGDEVLAQLRERSLEFRRGELSADALYDSASALLPAARFLELFGGLVAVIPDADARAVLNALLDERHPERLPEDEAPAPAPPPPPGIAAPPQPPPRPPPGISAQAMAMGLAPPPGQAHWAPPPRAPPRARQRNAPAAADFPTLGAGGVVRRSGPALRGSRPPPGLAAALAKATGAPGTSRRGGRTGLAVATQRRRAPAQPSPALAAAAQDFSAPPPGQRGKK